MDGGLDSAGPSDAVNPVFASRITVPPILYMGLGGVEAECPGVDWPDLSPDCPEGLLRFLRSRNTPVVDALMRSEIWKESGSSLPCELNARDRVLGKKNPSFPKGMLRPCTTWHCQLTLYYIWVDLRCCKWPRTKRQPSRLLQVARHQLSERHPQSWFPRTPG